MLFFKMHATLKPTSVDMLGSNKKVCNKHIILFTSVFQPREEKVIYY